mgnify:CR=1 FL=1
MIVRIPVSRRRFLATAAASTAITAIGGIAQALSQPRRRSPAASPMASSPATCRPTAAWSGRAPIGRRACWSRSRPPTASRLSARAVFVDALPETDFTANALIEGLPAGQDIFYRIRFQDLRVADRSSASR